MTMDMKTVAMKTVGMRSKAVAAVAVMAAAGVSLALGAGSASAYPGGTPGAVFVQTDGVTGNAVVAYSRAADGTLHRGGVYRTGGLGGVLDGSAVDHLASQGSLTYDRAQGLLYTVNAGSDTVTVFSVRGDKLIRRQIVSSGGDFPVSVAVHGDLVYVLNALGGGSVQGFRSVHGSLVKVPSWHRSLGLDPAATPQFTHTPGQLAFTPDGRALVVTTKAGANTIDVFPVHRTGIAARPVVTATPGAVPFGFTFDARGRLVVTEAGTNSVATFRIGADLRLTKVSEVATGQAATCWIARDGAHVYASNAGSGTLSGLRVGADGSLTAVGTTATGAGTVDADVSSDGRFLYAQTGKEGGVDEFRVNGDGSLTRVGSVVVPDAVGGEGIAAS
ncbi:lactonase family protein [Streptomyces hyaluromycini]|uniref:lactonase family protein n=1 Tax=Streptomyces hyaluromycini TaxID=1377993 RepID=UPI001FE4661C|nr:beta-propeller fold lactonase family protein [Streptomyces hyaluromycini]